MTNENRKKLEALRVNLYYSYRIRQTRFGITKTVGILTELKHFFAPLIVGEVATLAFEGTSFESLSVFKTPRKWHHSFFNDYKVFGF